MKTLFQQLDEYIEHARALNQSPVHLRIVRYAVLRMLHWLEETHGVQSAASLTRQHLYLWFKHLSARRTPRGLPLKLSTISKQMECDRVFIIWLERLGALPAGLSQALPWIKLPELLPTSVLQHKQMERLLAKVDLSTAAGLQLRAMLELFYSSGLRVTEMLSLNVEQIDLTNGTIRVMGKGSKERVVPMGDTARRFLESYLKGVRPLGLRNPAEPALWLNYAGERLQYFDFRRQLRAMTQQTRLPVHVTAHTFRRSCATELIRGGANIWHVKELLGHEGLETLKRYVKLTIVDLKKTHAKYHPRERDRK